MLTFKKNKLWALLLLGMCFMYNNPVRSQQKKPNILVFYLDDVGYGDFENYGNPTIKTPNINALAEDGIRFTSFEAAPWCVPSRAELMTGRYKPRTDFNGDTGADGRGGIPDNIKTIAQLLKDVGYVTGMAGKWHLGYKPQKYLPTNKGFDSWLGLPYSNDYKKPYVDTEEPLVMYRNTTVVENPVNQDSLTVKYTAETKRFIKAHSKDNKPFFFYMAYNMAHLPLHTTKEFYGKSKGGLRGDIIETLDWSVGQILETLDEEGLTENTIVFLASDNGPWQEAPPRMFKKPKEHEGSDWREREKRHGSGNKPWDAGSAGPLRGYKHTTYEGGPRVPAMIRWPGNIASGQVSDELVTSLDMFATFLNVGGGKRPDYTIDGMNMEPFLTGKEKHSPRKEFGYFKNEMEAIRVGEWKLRIGDGKMELFNLQYDPTELYNQAGDHPEIVEQLKKKMEKLAKDVGTTIKKL